MLLIRTDAADQDRCCCQQKDLARGYIKISERELKKIKGK
jgi:hypothetical protein